MSVNRRLVAVAQVERAGVQHGPAGQEFQGRRIGRRFGLDEHAGFLQLALPHGAAVRHEPRLET